MRNEIDRLIRQARERARRVDDLLAGGQIEIHTTDTHALNSQQCSADVELARTAHRIACLVADTDASKSWGVFGWGEDYEGNSNARRNFAGTYEQLIKEKLAPYPAARHSDFGNCPDERPVINAISNYLYHGDGAFSFYLGQAKEGSKMQALAWNTMTLFGGKHHFTKPNISESGLLTAAVGIEAAIKSRLGEPPPVSPGI